MMSFCDADGSTSGTGMNENKGIRILLTTVCKPYGVSTKDAEALGMHK